MFKSIPVPMMPSRICWGPRHCDAQRMAMARMGAVLRSMGMCSCPKWGSRIGILSG